MFEQELLAERSRVTPQKLAVVCVETGARLTYAELNAGAERAAAMLAARGIGPGDRFGILSYNSVEYLELFFAAGKIGAIVVPLATRATLHELNAIVVDSGMTWLYHGPEFAETAEALWKTGTLACPPPPRTGKSACPPQNDIYCLLYTSGTTGKPKGVMIPRRQLYWNGYNTVVNWGLREDDVSPIYTPLYHAGAIAAFTIPIFTVGGTMVLFKSFDPSKVWQTIERERCTVVLGVPTIWKMLMDAPEFATAKLNHVRWFISGGAPLPAYIAEAYAKRGVPMKQGYGMTEAGVNCFTMTVEESVTKRGSIGRPMMFTEVRVVDADGNDVAEGEVGEMWIRGPHVARGYWNNEEATRAAFRDDGFLRTGDLARRDADGFLTIAGRAKDMFISGGVNVYPAEIEAELVSHPRVADAAVVAVPDETWGEVGIAFVVGDATEDDLSSYLSLRIARFKLPKRYLFVDALPRTPYGKVEKAKLRERLT
ncbi:MAG TPA: AMP-binding protein [Thermoanaerobaculia bacterium]|nr:AMP-binding protein [Thermoanaerobaculia bacterium]